MAETFVVLVDARNAFDMEYDSVRDAYKNLSVQEFFEEIYQSVISHLENYLGTEINYFLPFADADWDDFICGTNDPEAIIEIAEGWNQAALEEVRECIEAFEKAGKKARLNSKSLVDILKYFENGGKVPGFPYDTALYELRQSLCMLDECITYGTYGMVLDCLDCVSTYKTSTKMSPNVLSDIKEHPENYVILDILYK